MGDEAAVWRELDFVADLLADGRPYLCGERFGAADLTFAALSAAAIVPPIYGTPLPQPDEPAARHGRAGAACARAPGGRYAMRMFEDHRREVVAALSYRTASASSSTWSGSGEAGKQITSSAPASSNAAR